MIALLISAVIVTLLGSNVAIHPINRLISKLERVKEMDLDVKLDRSYFSEMRSLESAFGSMIDRLRQFKQFVPDHLLNPDTDQEVEEKEQEPVIKPKGPAADIAHHHHHHQQRRDSTTTSTHSRSTTIQDKRFAVRLEEKNVTLLTVRVTNLYSSFKSTVTMDETMNQYGSVIDILQVNARRFGGQISRFDRESIEIVWSSRNARNDKRHIVRACSAVDAIRTSLSSIDNVNWMLSIQMCITSGQALLGNVGGKNQKQFMVMGFASEVATETKRLDELNVQVIMDEDTFESICEQYHSRPISTIQLPSTGQQIGIHEFGKNKNVKMDEWMYELEESKSKMNWDVYNSAYKKYLCGEYKQALELFTQHARSEPMDNVGLWMVKNCKELAKQ
ncbi:hypothetical protein AKO1_007121 [Acrasis kona]|uniref:HAMP domain-containing protein n=1 Tax=Acrasis kona TaxID=1008807 RepID=A0AAW2YUP3_9EUKA